MIIDAIPGLKLVEMQRNREYSRCCGAGGGLKAGYPDIQNKMAQRRVREAEETGAEYLVSCCPFCFQGLNVGVNAVESQLMMKDMSSLVAESLLGYDVFQKANEGSAVKVREKEGQSSSPQASRPGAPEVAETGNLDDERAAKKAARERRRAERRAVAGKEENRPTAFAQETLAEETSTLATEAKPVGTTEASVTDTVTVATDSQTDKNLERERKRAAKRAAREKEKAARRAARKKT
jgi:heterodisulfide reductase subunit D